MKKGAAFIIGKLSLIGAFFLGYNYSDDIDKIWLNIFERRRDVKEGYYQNIADLKIFYEKENGYFIPKYGVDDYKISIGEDLAPKDLYSLLERRIKNGDVDAGKVFNLLDSFYSTANGKCKR